MAQEILEIEARRFTTTAALAKAASVLLREDADCRVTLIIGPSQSFDDICAELSALNVSQDRIEVIRRHVFSDREPA